MEVVQLRPKDADWQDEVRSDTVETLEMWLADAKAGRFDAVAICGVCKDGSVLTNVPSHNAHPTLVGALSILQHRVLALAEPKLEER